MHMGILDIYFGNEQKRWVKSRIRGANSIFFLGYVAMDMGLVHVTFM